MSEIMKIEDLNLSVRSYNVLKRAGINTVEELQLFTDKDLMSLRGMGKHTLEEIREKLGSSTGANADRIRAIPEKFEQKIKGGEETICSTCIHKEVCRAIENQPCIECSKYEENGVWIENNKEKLIELLESAESAIYWSSDDRSFIEKIADHLISHRVVVLPKDTQDIRWSRIIELLIADSEGRVVILPTKEEVPAKDTNVPSKEENR